ncbi:flagellin [Zobellella aerophila]|uniref:Flagellin n=1 Tax=Zobellella aerophila TaxID=870480 RepID=A0ABP6VUQ1_9GAMM
MSVINTNITALISQNNLNKSQQALSTSMERLSSGLRINSAKDDAAGQAIANRMTSEIKGLAQAQRNANDGISLAQTAEGTLNQVNDNLQRIRDLTVQAQNGTNSSADIDSIQKEVNERLTEINRVTTESKFNGIDLFSATSTGTSFSIQVGSKDNQVIDINISGYTAAANSTGGGWNMHSSTGTAGIAAADGGTRTVSSFGFDVLNANALAVLDKKISNVDDVRSDLGAVQNRFESAIDNISTTATNLSAARSRIEDADYAVEVANMTRAQILQQAGTSVMAQANQVPQGVLSLLR